MPSPKDILLLVKREAEPPKIPPIHQQERDWSCGPAALVNACAILGIDTNESQLRQRSGTSFRNGTDEVGLLDAAASLGLDTETVWTSDRDGARRRLRGHLLDGCPVLLCVDKWDHWVTVSRGNDAESVTLSDPAEKSEEQISLWELIARWANPDEDRPFYAIILRL